ncbi:MAG TPA: amino acid permease [Gemmataceae bacterium]|nr:amino acid permease [Gemmataceae bacterium]
MSGLLAKKPLRTAASEGESQHLKRVLGPWSLTAMGIGGIIGTGIFVATGEVAKNVAGPALMVSYVVAGITCLFAALCYAEYAAMTPVAGSAYTYAYTTLGEIFAWIIGWDLILEYAIGAATVANGWSSYFQRILGKLHITLPDAISKAPLAYDDGAFSLTNGIINLPAVLIVGILTAILIKGIKESSTVNAVLVAVKVGAVLFVILVGAFYVNPSNWEPFAPYGWTGINVFGYEVSGQHTDKGKPLGMIAGAALIFFAYIGFDAVSTQAEEAKNPQRNVPIGILASLLICTVLYVAVVAVLTGMVHYEQIDEKAGVATAFDQVGLKWVDALVAAAAIAGITSVLLVLLIGSARVIMAMSRDGLLWQFLATIHPTFRTPWVGSIIIGLFVATFAGVLPLGALLELTNIGTLFAFAVVCGAVLILRYTDPAHPRPFRVPAAPVVCILGVLSCLLLMLSLPAQNWYRLFVWMAIGLIIYFNYGKQHSVVQGGTPVPSPPAPPPPTPEEADYGDLNGPAR